MSPAPQPLRDDELAQLLSRLNGWSGDGGGLARSWRFPDFAQAMAFMQACVAGIEAREHHPEWTNVYDRVSVRLRTHDAGDRVTERDADLAQFLDHMALRHRGR